MAWGCWEREGGDGEGPGGEKAPAGASTAAAVRNIDSAPEGSGHHCGSEEIQIALLREQSLLRLWGNADEAPAGADTAAARGNTEKAPAGADTTAVVGKYRESSCGSGHCCGSGEKTAGGSVWVTERRGCCGVSKGDGQLGSGGLP